MPAKAFVIRFPNGDFEYDVTRRAIPSIGETVRKQGLLWSVTRITHDSFQRVGVETVHVERVDAGNPRSASSSFVRESFSGVSCVFSDWASST